MDIWVTNEKRRQSPASPRRGLCWQHLKGDEEWEGPDLGDETDEEAFVEAFGYVCPEEEL